MVAMVVPAPGVIAHKQWRACLLVLIYQSPVLTRDYPQNTACWDLHGTWSTLFHLLRLTRYMIDTIPFVETYTVHDRHYSICWDLHGTGSTHFYLLRVTRYRIDTLPFVESYTVQGRHTSICWELHGTGSIHFHLLRVTRYRIDSLPFVQLHGEWSIFLLCFTQKFVLTSMLAFTHNRDSHDVT